MNAITPARLLLIEDDQRLAVMVKAYLEKSAFVCDIAPTGEQGLAAIRQHVPSAVLLDLMLPDADGLELCKQIRAFDGEAGRVPIIMLTAKGDPLDRIVGLELGADDYVPKPFEPRELLARIKAVLRRQGTGALAEPHNAGAVLHFGSLTIDTDAREVRVDERLCELTTYQFDLLVALATRAGRVLSRDQIMELVRGKELDAYDRSIDVHIGRIRAAIERDIKAPARILTVRGVGYVFAKQQD
jgi:DNA-binding response OmpR family regulator